MTSSAHDEPAVRTALQERLRMQGEIDGELRLVGAPIPSDRSILYRYTLGAGGASFLVKQPLPGDAPIDSNPPLGAAELYRAMEQAHQWFSTEEAHAAARPVALLDDVEALAMEFVEGPDLGQVLHRSRRDPGTAVAATRAAGDFLRRLHGHADAGTVELDLRELADDVDRARRESLLPVGLEVPKALLGCLSSVGPRTVRTRQVLLHGDFVPKNLLLTGAGELTMIDPSLVQTGPREEDLARFLCVLSSDPAFVPGAVLPRLRRTRRRTEIAFREGYGLPIEGSAVLELRLLKQLVLRWRRRRSLTSLAGHAQLMRARSVAIDMHMRSLLAESTTRLERALQPAAS